jgi:hypothetical protein
MDYLITVARDCGDAPYVFNDISGLNDFYVYPELNRFVREYAGAQADDFYVDAQPEPFDERQHVRLRAADVASPYNVQNLH